MPGAYAHIAIARSLGTRKTLVDKYDIPSEISQIILEKPEYIELGSVSPDYPYLAKQNLWADNMHYKANGSLIKSGIDILAKENINDDATRKKVAWLLGFAAHVIADITVHPIVAGIVGPYEGNERAHRECEVNQDAYAFNKMNWGELCEVDCFETGIQQCSDQFGHLVPEVVSFWQQLLEINCATDYAVTLPHIGRWHVGYTNLMDNFAEEANRFSILAPFVVRFGLACPHSADVDPRYISNLLTPTGNRIRYDELFNYAASNIGKVWGTIAHGILGLDTEYETKIKNWNLDTGMSNTLSLITERVKRHRKLIIPLLLLLAWSWWYPGYRQEMTRRPLDVQITIAPPGEIRTQIHIPLEENYELLLGFDRTGRDFRQWKALLGHGPPIYKRGIPIMVRWELYEKSKLVPIKSREVQTFGVVSANKDYIFRMIDMVRVPRGDYEIVVKLLQEVPEITNPQGKVLMRLPAGKDGQLTADLKLISWIGLLMIEPLLWIVEAALVILLVFRLVRDS